MNRIRAIYFERLRNEAHYEFLWIFGNLLDMFPAVKALILVWFDPFTGLLGKEKTLLDAARASALTGQIAEADSRVDRTLSGIRATVNAARHSLDATVAEAARVLQIRLREFGNVNAKAYEEESAAVQVLLDDLAGTYAPQVALTGLDVWVTELSEAETAFTQLYLQRNTETAQRPQERMTDVRREIEAVYRGMITVVAAAAIMDTTGAYDEFIAQHNAEIVYFNEHNHRHARKDIGAGDACAVDAIDSQSFTGKAITPLPAARYHDGSKPAVDLVFAKDFSVTYKNNVNPGTAECTLHGKGAYKGQKTVTFMIV